jgi:hypothetical protein
VLYQLSYLARCAWSLPARNGRQALDEGVDEIALEQDGVGAGLGNSLVQLGIGVAGERDQAELRVILAQARHRRHAVDQGHVDVDHDSIGLERLRELDRAEPVGRGADDGQLGLVLDQRLERFEEALVVVREDDANRR